MSDKDIKTVLRAFYTDLDQQTADLLCRLRFIHLGAEEAHHLELAEALA